MPIRTFYPSADSFFTDDYPTNTHGSDTILRIGQSVFPAGSSLRHSVLKFDLGAIKSQLLPGEEIVSIELRMVIENDTAEKPGTVECYRLLRDWVESEVNWNEYSSGNSWQTGGASGANDRDATLVGSFTTTASDSGPKTMTLDTDIVLGMMNGTYPNYGWILVTQAEDDDAYDYYSSEGGSPPALVVTTSIVSETLEVPISSGPDDGYATASTFNNNNDQVYLNSAGGAFFRFASVSIPKSAQIYYASLVLTRYQSLLQYSWDLQIYGHADANAAAPTDLAEFNALAGVLTTAYTAWQADDSWLTDTETETPDIGPVVREIMDLSGWESGDPMQFPIYMDPHGASITVKSYDLTTVACAKLKIYYTLGGGAPSMTPVMVV